MLSIQKLFINKLHAPLFIKKFQRVSAFISGHHLGAPITHR